MATFAAALAAASAQAQDIKVDTAKAFAGPTPLVVGAFVVAFDIKKADTAKAGGGLFGSGFGGRSSAYSVMTGVDDATLQALTDQAYADFIAKLKTAGVTVNPRDPLLAHPDFAKAKIYPAPHEEDQSTIMSNGNDTKYFVPTGFEGLRPNYGVSFGMADGFALGRTIGAEADYAEKNGVRVLNVIYHVDFANAEKYGGWARSWSTVKVGAGIALPPGQTVYYMVGGQGGTFSTKIGSLTLNEPIGSNVDFAVITDTTSGAAQAAQTVANVIGVLGGVGTNSSTHYEFAARKADYQTGAAEILAKGNDAMIGKMKALQ